jgi:hypothetical protein
MRHSQHFCHFLNASWKLCYVRVFNTAYSSASITSVVSKWRPFSFVFNRGNREVGWVGEDSHVAFGNKFPGEKGSMRWCFVVMQQPWGEVFARFHTFARNHHNALDFALHLSLLLTYCVRLMLSSQNSSLFIAKVSITLFLRFVQSLMHPRCQIHCKITSHPNKGT